MMASAHLCANGRVSSLFTLSIMEIVDLTPMVGEGVRSRGSAIWFG